MPTNDCPDTCMSLICPGSNHGEQQSSAFLKEIRSQFSLRRRLMRISSEERMRMTRQTWRPFHRAWSWIWAAGSWSSTTSVTAIRPGDTVVYVPEARVAWTGNLIVGGGEHSLSDRRWGRRIPGDDRKVHTLEVGTIVPGHGLLTSAAILSRYLSYLSELIESMRKAIRAGQSLEEAIAATPLEQKYTQDAAGSSSPLVAQFVAFRAGLHRWNVWRTYQGMKRDLA
jgi:hypothetical protein